MTDERNQIAIIDDDPDVAELFSEGLQMAGYKTVTFNDAEDTIEHIATNHLEIALATVDWGMPLIDGFRIIRLITETDNNIKFLLISGYDLPQDQLKLYNNAIFLKKPIRIANLIEIVKKELSSNNLSLIWKKQFNRILIRRILEELKIYAVFSNYLQG